MNNSRPALQEGLSAADFRRFYWRKDELVPFCRACGLSTTGAKADLVSRVEKYLAGEQVGDYEVKARKRGARIKATPITLDSPLTPGYRCSEEARAFFKSVLGPQFHFTVRMIKFCREHPEQTYRDAAEAWKAEREERKSGRAREIMTTPVCEYNRFVRAYLADRPGKTLKDAAEAWNERKAKPRDSW